ncbi:hypothetical protein A4R26_04480 [Niastella populi]|uniref:DUF5977 domain-containing protein n=2 Tax=Niastella populi TaxID=550983 RepID=A0A1V9FDH2_9BACT|nr:hypothetical protein A4R26_04480 [Niastella populi]
MRQDNNPYTGTSTLNIPLYDLQFGKNSLPVNLSYNTRAIQVDQLPSWVGLGWNLNIGGQVSRVVNGKPDELRETKSYTIINTTISGGSAYTTSTSVQILTSNDFGYINNYSKLNNSNWASYDYTFNTLNKIPADEQLPGMRIITNLDNNTVTQDPVLAFDVSRNYDFEPDEFYFSVGNVSGKFYLNHNGEWKCESPGGNFMVEVTAPATNIIKGSVPVPRMIYQIVITGPDGTRYYFGGDASNKLKNVEFWRGPTGAYSGNGDGNVFGIFGNTYLSVVPDAWLITKIETPDNYTVNFEYKKGKLQLQYADAPWGEGTGTSFTRFMPGYLHQSMAEPWYLTKIVCSNNTSIELQSEDSHQLNTDLPLRDLTPHSTFTNYGDIVGAVINDKNNLQKLIGLQVKNGSEVIKSFAFEYIENLTERLKLTALKELSPDGRKYNSKYSFVYNSGKLPVYGSGKVDHLGFYNNKRFFVNNTQTAYALSRTDFETQYYNSREPDFIYAKYETLDKVYFPTGGYRKYEYQENDYSQAITRWPFGVTPAGGNLVTGGIRVHKISDYLQDGSLANETEFIYKTAISGSTSSGVLSIPRPKYTDDKSGGGYYFSTTSFTPFDRIQSHITYSTVFEKRRDGSYKKYVFSNYDNGTNDNQPTYETATPAFWDAIPYVNNSFRRGAVKELTLYDNQGNPVKKSEYKYQDEYDDYSRFIRAVRIKRHDQPASYRASACPKYYFPNVVRYEKEESISTVAGSQVKETNYAYDGYNNLVEVKSSNSKGEETKTLFKYPYNFSTGNTNNPYRKMTDRYMVNYTVEQRNVLARNGQELLTGASINDYAEFGGPVFMPRTTYELRTKKPVAVSTVANTNYDDANGTLSVDAVYGPVNYFNYDNKGNVLEKRPFAGPVENYQWAYNQRYPVVKLVNPQHSVPSGVKVYFSEGFEDNGSASIDHPYSGRRYLSGDFQVPFTKPDARNYLVDYRYYDNGTWKYMCKAFNNNMSLTEGDGIDDVRVFPSNTQIYSYTFSPLGGMTSETDLNGKTVFYEYDDFGRLSVVRDQDKNIVKTFCYNYLGQPINCLPAYGNDLLTQEFTRTTCGPGYVGGKMDYLLSPGLFVSFKNKDEANAMARNYINQNGQAYVDQHGPCIQIVYARLEYDNYTDVVIEEEPHERILEELRADLYIRFYSDEACTQRAVVHDVILNVHLDPQALVYNDSGEEEMEIGCGGDDFALIANNVTVNRTDSYWNTDIQWWQTIASWQMQHYLRASPVPFVIIK